MFYPSILRHLIRSSVTVARVTGTYVRHKEGVQSGGVGQSEYIMTYKNEVEIVEKPGKWVGG